MMKNFLIAALIVLLSTTIYILYSRLQKQEQVTDSVVKAVKVLCSKQHPFQIGENRYICVPDFRI